jgi:hypothetical protein
MDTILQIVFVALGVATLATMVLAIDEWDSLGSNRTGDVYDRRD